MNARVQAYDIGGGLVVHVAHRVCQEPEEHRVHQREVFLDAQRQQEVAPREELRAGHHAHAARSQHHVLHDVEHGEQGVFGPREQALQQRDEHRIDDRRRLLRVRQRLAIIPASDSHLQQSAQHAEVVLAQQIHRRIPGSGSSQTRVELLKLLHHASRVQLQVLDAVLLREDYTQPPCTHPLSLWYSSGDAFSMVIFDDPRFFMIYWAISSR